MDSDLDGLFLAAMHVINSINEGIARGGKQMSAYVLGFQDIDQTQRMVVGGKHRRYTHYLIS